MLNYVELLRSGTQVISDNMMSVSRVKEDSLTEGLPVPGNSQGWYGARFVPPSPRWSFGGTTCFTLSLLPLKNPIGITQEEDRKKAMMDKQEHAKHQITKIFRQLGLNGHLPG